MCLRIPLQAKVRAQPALASPSAHRLAMAPAMASMLLFGSIDLQGCESCTVLQHDVALECTSRDFHIQLPDFVALLSSLSFNLPYRHAYHSMQIMIGKHLRPDPRSTGSTVISRPPTAVAAWLWAHDNIVH